MNNLSSSINCIKSTNLIFNKDYQQLLTNAGLDCFDSIYGFNTGKICKQIKARTLSSFEIQSSGIKKRFFLKIHNTEFIGFRRLLALFFPDSVYSQGRIEFKNICDFRKQGIATVIPVATGEKFTSFFRVKSFLITENFSPFIQLEELLRDNPEFFTGPAGESRKTILLKKIALLAKKMHRSGFNHRDFNATHILLHYKNRSDTPEIALFDLQRVAKNKFSKFRWTIKSIAEVNYTLPDSLFGVKDRLFLFLSYKRKNRLNFLDKVQWLIIKIKTIRIGRHIEKKKAKKKGMRNGGN